MTEDSDARLSRRKFIQGIVAAGAAASSSAYLFRSTTVHGQPQAGAVERLVTLRVNGQDRRVDLMPQETLAMVLRYKLGLTGTKLGCDRAECGACTVLIDDVPHYSCSVLAHRVRGKSIVTIEGLADPATGRLHAVQQGVVDEQGFQQSSGEMRKRLKVKHRWYARLMSSDRDPSQPVDDHAHGPRELLDHRRDVEALAAINRCIDVIRRRRTVPLGMPEDVAHAALFLASEASNHISGKLLHVNDDWKKLEHANLLSQ
jgi:hypothetical protein